MAVPPMPASAPKQPPRRPAGVQKAAMQAQRRLNRNMLVLGVTVLLLLGGLAAFLASRNVGNIFNIFQNTTNQIIHNSYFTQLIAEGATTMEDLRSIEEIRPYGDGFIGISKAQLNWSQAGELAKRTGSEVLAVEDSATGTKQQLVEWLKNTFAAQFQPTLWVQQDGQGKVTDGNDVLAGTSLESTRKVTLHWKSNAGRTTSDPALATKDQPFENSLGMKFVPVPGTKVLFCIHETRRQDYAVYASEVADADDAWTKTPFFDIPKSDQQNHPASHITWEQAREFCGWLSKKDGLAYRLPTDREWSFAVGIGAKESAAIGVTPEMLQDRDAGQFPWGGSFPPKTEDKAGNYADGFTREKFPEYGEIEGYSDGFIATAPVMSFKPNEFGIYDLGGNVWEWVDDWYDHKKTKRTLRGASFRSSARDDMLSARRHRLPTAYSNNHPSDLGFRVVLDEQSQAFNAAADETRMISEWILKAGGNVWVLQDGQSRRVRTVDELPTNDFEVSSVLLDARAKASINENDLPRLGQLAGITHLALPMQNISDNALKHLSAFSTIESLDLNWCPQLIGSGLQPPPITPKPEQDQSQIHARNG
jgi:hypothetical protein